MADWDYARSIRRIFRLMGALALAGMALAWVTRGVTGLLSFAGGAAVSATGFWWLKRMSDDLQAAAEGRPVKLPSVLAHAFRVLILGGAAYAIVKTYGSDRPVFAAGLLLAVAAATLDVLIEIIYARA